MKSPSLINHVIWFNEIFYFLWKIESITFPHCDGDNGIGSFWKTTKQAIFRKSWVRVLGTVTWKKPLLWRLQKALKLRFLPLFFQGSIITDSYSDYFSHLFWKRPCRAKWQLSENMSVSRLPAAKWAQTFMKTARNYNAVMNNLW